MPKTAVEEWDVAAGNNTDVGGVSIAEGMAPGKVNDALREIMAQVKAWWAEERVGQIRVFGYAPAGRWLECDGAAVSRTTYAALFAKIGTAFGTGDGSTTFDLPDLRGRAPLGAGQGDTAEGGGTGTLRALGDKAGAETHTLAAAEMQHDHGIGRTGRDTNPGADQLCNDARTGSVQLGTAPNPVGHNNVGPALVVRFYIGY